MFFPEDAPLDRLKIKLGTRCYKSCAFLGLRRWLDTTRCGVIEVNSKLRLQSRGACISRETHARRPPCLRGILEGSLQSAPGFDRMILQVGISSPPLRPVISFSPSSFPFQFDFPLTSLSRLYPPFFPTLPCLSPACSYRFIRHSGRRASNGIGGR